MMNQGKNAYLGTVDNILKAAILYDIFAIQAKGKKAKTNFSFTRKEICAIFIIPELKEAKRSTFDNGAQRWLSQTKIRTSNIIEWG